MGDISLRFVWGDPFAVLSHWTFWKTTLLRRAPILGALGLTLALGVYERLLLPLNPAEFADRFSPLGEVLVQAASAAAVAFFFWGAFSSRGAVRWAYGVIFVAGLLTEHGYIYAMGRFSRVQDYYLGLFGVDVYVLKNAFSAYLGLRWTTLLPVGVFVALLVLTRRFRAGGWRRLGAVLTGMTALFALLYPFSQGTFPAVSVGASWRTLTFAGVKWVTTYHGPRESLPVWQEDSSGPNVVFIVDESIRCDHLSLNGYARPTTPYLEALQAEGKLTNWGCASSAATASMLANTLLSTGIHTFPDPTQAVYRKPNLFQYARAAGYETYLVDGQLDKPWFLTRSEMRWVDHWKRARDFARPPMYGIDPQIAQYLRQELRGASGKFFWVNKMGVHIPYSDHYPPSSALWLPASADYLLPPERQPELVNAYDNGLAYNLDAFFKELMADGALENTIILYTSDHGQTLAENGETWPHNANTPNEARVPLFILHSDPLQADTRYPASHFNLFATALDALGIPEDLRRYPYAPSLFTARLGDPTFRYYMDNLPDDHSDGELYWLDSIPTPIPQP